MRKIKRVNEVLVWIIRNASTLITIALLASYTFISYRTYVIQQQRYEIEHLAYQITLYIEELEHQNKCMDEILEFLDVFESHLTNSEAR